MAGEKQVKFLGKGEEIAGVTLYGNQVKAVGEGSGRFDVNFGGVKESVKYRPHTDATRLYLDDGSVISANHKDKKSQG